MRVGCFVPIVAIVMVIGGGQSVYTGLTNRKPLKVDMGSIAKSMPDAKWLEISGGEFDVVNAAYSSAFGVGKASSIHVPLVLPGEDSQESTIRVLVETDDATLVGLVNQMRDMEKGEIDEKAAMTFLLENSDKLRLSRPVRGLVKYGMESGKQERKVKEMYDNLSADVILLKEGEKPDMMVGSLILVAGLVLSGFIVLKGRGAPDPPQGTPPPLPTPGTGGPPA